jgi:hypothetical protein
VQKPAECIHLLETRPDAFAAKDYEMVMAQLASSVSLDDFATLWKLLLASGIPIPHGCVFEAVSYAAMHRSFGLLVQLLQTIGPGPGCIDFKHARIALRLLARRGHFDGALEVLAACRRCCVDRYDRLLGLSVLEAIRLGHSSARTLFKEFASLAFDGRFSRAATGLVTRLREDLLTDEVHVLAAWLRAEGIRMTPAGERHLQDAQAVR